MVDYEFTIMRYDEAVMHVKFGEGNSIEITKFTEDKHKLPFYFEPTKETMFIFIQDRCSERSRPDQKELLALIGLDEYNPYEIVKKTHGVTPDDHFWFKFPGENLTWKDVDGYGRF